MLAQVAACGLLAVSLLVAQQPAPLFRAGTKLVEVEVTVLDKKGNPVTGLKQADFTLRDEGKVRPIAFFHFDGAVAPAPATPAPSTSPFVFRNRVDSGDEWPNITALAMDGLNTPPDQNAVVRSQVMRYLKTLIPQTRIAIFYMGPDKFEILHDFTADTASLRARLEKVPLGMTVDSVTDSERSIQEAQAFVNLFAGTSAAKVIAASEERQLEMEFAGNAAARRSRLERSLEALEIIGRHLAAIPGRKNLVWIGAGFSMISIDTTGPKPFNVGDNFEGKIREVARRLAQDGVVLYIVDSKGIPMSPIGRPAQGTFADLKQAEELSSDPHTAMNLLASVTGGRYLFNTNDLTSGFRQALADVQGSYRLGFYAPEEQQGQWHRLKIQVDRSGATVRHREGYPNDSASAPAVWTDESWRAAMANPLGSSVISLTARYGAVGARNRVLDLAIGVDGIYFHRDGDDLKADLQIAVSELTAAGEALPTYTDKLNLSVPSAKWEETSKAGIPFHRQWTPSPNAARTRVVVLDMATGQYGSVDIQAH